MVEHFAALPSLGAEHDSTLRVEGCTLSPESPDHDDRGVDTAHRPGAPALSTQPTLIQSFDAYAASYDRSLEPILALKGVIHELIRWRFSTLPATAHVLLVGAGTAGEARFLAPLFPAWRFTLVDPSAGMLEVGRGHAIAEGFADRCTFHAGFVSSLAADGFDAATSVLVSHFLPDATERQAFYAEIARRLKPEAPFFTADLCADTQAASFDTLMDLWLAQPGIADDRKVAFRTMFGKAIAVHGPSEVEAMIAHAGFSPPVPCLQAALIRGWVATRAPTA